MTFVPYYAPHAGIYTLIAAIALALVVAPLTRILIARPLAKLITRGAEALDRMDDRKPLPWATLPPCDCDAQDCDRRTA